MKDKIYSDDTKVQQTDEREVSLGRHKVQCSICKHPQCKDIEDDWLNWTSPAKIQFDYRVSRDALRRHCRALDLHSKRRKSLMPAYERIVERGDTVEYNGSHVISAIRELAKLINAQKAAGAAQSADPKAAVQETTAKERVNGALAGSLPELLDEMPCAESGKGQNEQKEPQGPEPPTVQ